MINYNFKEANDVISKFMNKEDDYKSLDKLIEVWKQVSGVLWDMEGFIFEFSFDHDSVSSVDISSNWQAQGLGGYPDAIEFDCSHYDDDNHNLTVQERALIVTAKVISYEINKDYKSDFSKLIEFTGLTRELLEGDRSVDYTKFKRLSEKDPRYLISLINENQLPPHMMEHALSNLACYNKTTEVFNLLIKYTDSVISKIRTGAYQGIYYFKEEKDLISLFEDFRIKEKSYLNHYELDRHIRNLKKYKEENSEN